MARRKWSLAIPLVDTTWQHGQSYGAVETVSATPAAKAVLPEGLWTYRDLPVLTLDWNDFGVPSIGRDWWTLLVETIIKFPEGSKVAVYCQGGHGRTGTALAIILAMAGLVPEGGDPVAYVRQVYDKGAVESRAQIAYIEGITGFDVKSYPADFSPLIVRTGIDTKFQAEVLSSGSDLEFKFEPHDLGIGPDYNPEEIATDAEGNVYIYGSNGEVRMIPKGKRIRMSNSVSVSGFTDVVETS